MNGDTIKEFLVGLGFGVDDASLAKFNKSIQSASLRVTALYASVKVLAAGIFWSISKISEGFEQMGYEYRIIAPAINKTLVLRQELLKAYRAAGVDITKVIQQSVKFNMSLAKTQFAFKALAGSLASKFFPMLTKQMDVFRKNIYANMPVILAALEKFVNFIFKAFEVTTILGTRVWSILSRIYDFFVTLHKATDGWSTILMGVIAAWKLLNLSFLATPLGMLLTGLLAILALWDDFQVWREGGKSLFNWSSFIPTIDAVAQVIRSVRDALDGVFTVIFNVWGMLKALIALDWSAFGDRAADAFGGLVQIVTKLWETLKNLFGTAGALGEWAMQLFGGAAPQATSEQWKNWGQVGVQQPLGTQAAAGAQTNQNVTQQTEINVMGSADAQATSKAVASQQSRVNFDMVRNLKGATR